MELNRPRPIETDPYITKMAVVNLPVPRLMTDILGANDKQNRFADQGQPTQWLELVVWLIQCASVAQRRPGNCGRGRLIQPHDL